MMDLFVLFITSLLRLFSTEMTQRQHFTASVVIQRVRRRWLLNTRWKKRLWGSKYFPLKASVNDCTSFTSILFVFQWVLFCVNVLSFPEEASGLWVWAPGWKLRLWAHLGLLQADPVQSSLDGPCTKAAETSTPSGNVDLRPSPSPLMINWGEQKAGRRLRPACGVPALLHQSLIPPASSLTPLHHWWNKLHTEKKKHFGRLGRLFAA